MILPVSKGRYALSIFIALMLFNFRLAYSEIPPRSLFNFVFENNYNNDQLGKYSIGDFNIDWQYPQGTWRQDETDILTDGDSHGNYMRGYYPVGTHGGATNGFTWINFNFVSGQWYNITFRLVLNTVTNGVGNNERRIFSVRTIHSPKKFLLIICPGGDVFNSGNLWYETTDSKTCRSLEVFENQYYQILCQIEVYEKVGHLKLLKNEPVLPVFYNLCYL